MLPVHSSPRVHTLCVRLCPRVYTLRVHLRASICAHVCAPVRLWACAVCAPVRVGVRACARGGAHLCGCVCARVSARRWTQGRQREPQGPASLPRLPRLRPHQRPRPALGGRLPAMEEEPMMVTWGSLACTLEEMWPMTVSTVSIKPSTTALSCKRHNVKELSKWNGHNCPLQTHSPSSRGPAPHWRRRCPLPLQR